MKLAALLLILVVFAGCHVPGHQDETSGDSGNGCFLGICPQEQPKKQEVKKKENCAPSVAWALPGAGTVVDVKTCPGLFGTEMRYIQIDSGPRLVWTTDPGGVCKVGADWGPTTC